MAMHLKQITISGFRSFGPILTTIPINNDLVGFIGLNSSGKTAALESLKKLFGSSGSEREIYYEDFHVEIDENPSEVEEKLLSIEVLIDFDGDEEDGIPHFFNQMVVDEEDTDPYIRVRLEATWRKSAIRPEGDIEANLYFIKVPEGGAENEETKQFYPSHLRSLIQILYVPAIRKPGDQIKYVSGSILYRILRKINWDARFKEEFQEHITEISALFKQQTDVEEIQNSIKTFWNRFHKDSRYKETDINFGGNDLEAILKKLEISFSPTPSGRPFRVDDLGEGYRSLFYLTLVCALLDFEEKLAASSEEIEATKPLLTILAIEEPENHIAPQLLGRVVNILKTISEKNNTQVILSSHTPSIVKRINPKGICHFQISDKLTTVVSTILLPDSTSEAYKYVKEAIYNYPEIYFAKLVVIGEGDSEDVLFNRLMVVKKVNFDDNIIAFAPLGHRFVNHIWKLLSALNIPFITLLDLDAEREGGGFGRVKYAMQQLLEVGADRNELLLASDGSLIDLPQMHTWTLNTTKDLELLTGWAESLRKYDVYFSAPLDLDFLLLESYPDVYKAMVPNPGGPRIPDKAKDKPGFTAKVETAVKATLKSETAKGDLYSEDQKELMIWYNYHFLGRGKPATHIQALAAMTNRQIQKSLPEIFDLIFERIAEKLQIED